LCKDKSFSARIQLCHVAVHVKSWIRGEKLLSLQNCWLAVHCVKEAQLFMPVFSAKPGLWRRQTAISVSLMVKAKAGLKSAKFPFRPVFGMLARKALTGIDTVKYCV